MELKPCPFCGEPPQPRLDDYINGRMVADPKFFITCENADCGVWPEAEGQYETEYDAIVAAWNRRADVAVRVKPLVWEAVNEKRWVAVTIFGICAVDIGWHNGKAAMFPPDGGIEWFENDTEARDAYAKRYAACIFAALDLPPATHKAVAKAVAEND